MKDKTIVLSIITVLLMSICVRAGMPGDFEPDGDVDFKDFSVFAAPWLTETGESGWNPACDIAFPPDNLIDSLDLAAFSKHWLVSESAGLANPLITVAAVDSSMKAQANADYVCDGVADEVEIQAALDALPAVGGKVLCLEGSYVFQSSLLYPGSNIELDFLYGSSIKIVAEGHSLDTMIIHTDTVSYLIGAVSRDNVKLRGVRMDWEAGYGQSKFSTAANYSGILFDDCTNVLIDDCRVDNVVNDGSICYRQFGILCVNCKDFVVLKSEGNHCGYEGIGVRSGCTNGAVAFCRGEGSYAHSIQAAGWAPSINEGAGPTNILFLGNNCGPRKTDDILIHGFQGKGAGAITFVGNVVSRIKVLGEVSGVNVTGNTVYGSGAANIILNNTAESGTDCILENVVVSGNAIDFADYSGQATVGGIQVSSQVNNTANGIIRNILISDNTLRNRFIQITTADGSNTDIENVTIANNNISIFNTSKRAVKIETKGPGGGSIKRTSITGSNLLVDYINGDGYGIELDTDAASTGTIEDTYISGNNLNVDYRGLFVDENGAAITNVHFVNNFVTVPDTASMIETEGATGNLYVRNNEITNCGYGVHSTGSANLIVIENNNFVNIDDDIIGGDLPITSVIKNNQGDAEAITENEGTGQIDGESTADVITHGLRAAPTHIGIAFIEHGSSDYGRWWVSDIDGTTFTLNVSSQPGVSNLSFSWEAKVR